MNRPNEAVCHLSDEELAQVQRKADREMIDPGLWMRRVAISVANGTARVTIVEER